ncbi:sulfatase [Verrucomicrobiaceae bacterium R5-34]|nr:sulfatase [Verrucomicrobiaceae bacterium R5-34]
MRFTSPLKRLVTSLFFLAPLTLSAEQKANILFICVDDLRPELGCYGKEHMYTPNIDRLAAQGRLFSRHYVQVPTCGASRAALLTGRYPRTGADLGNGAISAAHKRAQSTTTLPQTFRDNGYTTISIGKVSHHPGGLMGKEWNDPSKVEMPGAWDQHLMPSGEWKTPQRAMHGLAHGVPRSRGKSPAIEIEEGADTLYPDGLITNTALEHISQLAKQEKPWLLAVGLIKPHLPFTAPKQYWDLYEGKDLPPVQHPEKPERSLTWSKSGEFLGGYSHEEKDPREDTAYAAHVRRHYYASVSYVDAQVGKILNALEQSGQKDHTIVVLWGDHGWNLGERRIWGKHNLYEEALHSPLIIRSPEMKQAGTAADAITETIDIFPTLCELTGVAKPNTLDGASLAPQLKVATAESDGIARSFWKGSQSLRTDRYRLTRQTSKSKATDYNLFLFPETEAPNNEQTQKVAAQLESQFFTP